MDIKHTAKLANLTLSNEEEERFAKQLSAILGHIQKLQKVNTENVQETSQVTGLENALREDVPGASLSAQQALSNAKVKHNDLFQVQGILED